MLKKKLKTGIFVINIIICKKIWYIDNMLCLFGTESLLLFYQVLYFLTAKQNDVILILFSLKYI